MWTNGGLAPPLSLIGGKGFLLCATLALTFIPGLKATSGLDKGATPELIVRTILATRRIPMSAEKARMLAPFMGSELRTAIARWLKALTLLRASGYSTQGEHDAYVDQLSFSLRSAQRDKIIRSKVTGENAEVVVRTWLPNSKDYRAKTTYFFVRATDATWHLSDAMSVQTFSWQDGTTSVQRKTLVDNITRQAADFEARQSSSMRSASRRPSMRPCVRNALVIAKASAAVGSLTGRMFHSACVPNSEKARRYRLAKSSGAVVWSFMNLYSVSGVCFHTLSIYEKSGARATVLNGPAGVAQYGTGFFTCPEGWDSNRWRAGRRCLSAPGRPFAT